jgi:hypothetical protein
MGYVYMPFVAGHESLKRYVIDFHERTIFEAQQFPGVFQRIEKLVLPDRKRKASRGLESGGKGRPHHKRFLGSWWRLSWNRADMIEAFRSLRDRYVVCARVTKRPIFVFSSTEIRPGDALQVFVFDDDYSFGVLQSNAHWQWFVAKCSKLTERFRYTPESVFDTFPWPQKPKAKQVRAVAKAGREVRRIRGEALSKIKGGLRAVYRTLELPGKNPLKDAHAALDAAVMDAYGFSQDGDLLSLLFDLNLEVAKRIERGDPVTAPGIPPGYPSPRDLITDDCIRP